jgi:hypothetical protein
MFISILSYFSLHIMYTKKLKDATLKDVDDRNHRAYTYNTKPIRSNFQHFSTFQIRLSIKKYFIAFALSWSIAVEHTTMC